MHALALGHGLTLTSAHIQDGDIVVIRSAGMLSVEAAKRIGEDVRRACADAGVKPARILVLDEGLSLDVVSEAEMAQLGWVRASKAEG